LNGLPGRENSLDPTPDSGSAGTTQRVVAALALLAEAGDSAVSVRKGSELTGISRSAMQRILSKLADEGVAEAMPDGRYIAGPVAYEWASRLQAKSTFLDCAHRVMTELVRRFDESVYLTRLLPAELAVTFVHVVECQQAIRYVVPTGTRSPLHAGAAGKAVLAWLPESTVERLTLSQFTDRTMTERARLVEDLAKARERGYSVSAGERILEAVGIAAPIISAGRPIGSMSITVPASRFHESDIEVYGRAVSEAAHQVSRLMKGVPSTIAGSA
jgi:DNA-binding IclR family transcriptional regulator